METKSLFIKTAIAVLLWGGVASAAPLHLTVHLKPSGQGAVDRLIKEQQTEGSPNFHKWLATGEFDQRFSQSKQEEQAVAAWLISSGCAIRKSTHRLVQTDCPTMPVVPANLKGIVSGIRDRARRAKPAARVSSIYGTLQALGPYDLYNYANIPYPVTNGGAGQTICIIAGADVLPAIYPHFDSVFNLPSINFQRRLDGSNPGEGDDTGEAELDTQVAHEIAPNAEILMYLGDVSITQLMQDAADDNVCAVVNISFAEAGEGDASTFHPIYAQMAAQGQTPIVACGDYTNGDLNGFGTDPNVSCIGGTNGINGPNYPSPGYINPTPFNQTTYYNGGASGVYSKPSWQTGTGVPADGARDVPDWSAYALGGTWLYVDNYSGSSVTFTDSGGTSAAAPFWSGLAALLVQNVGHRIGPLNPIIYPIANSGIGFFDVTTGSVGGYCSANIGFDLCTGWGTPNFGALSRAVQQQFWSGQGGPF